MNNLKRIASAVIILAMMLQIAVVAAPVPEDVIGTQYESAASLLCALDIMVGDGENFNPDDNITRAEFAQILMRTMNLDGAAESYTPVGKFSDVPADNIFAPAVELGAEVGAIQGYGDGTFGPENNVLGIEAIKMMTFASGHSVLADDMGGYPAGYLAVANDKSMLNGLSGVDFNQPMKRGEAAILCANTLKVDMMQLIESGPDYQKYEEIKDENLLSEKHSVYRFDGLVTANAVTGMFGSSSLREGTVQMEQGNVSKILEVGETTIDDAVGKYVRVYYKLDEDSTDETVISYEVMSNRNDSTTVAIEDLDIDNSTSTLVKYWEDKENDTRTQDIDVIESPSIIYNGVAKADVVALIDVLKSIENMEGEVVFMDYNNNGDTDLVRITAYDTFVVDNVDMLNYIITDRLGTYDNGTMTNKTVKIDVDSSAVTAKFEDVDGEEYEMSDIAAWDVLSVAISDDNAGNQMADVKISQDTIEGEITEIGAGTNELTFYIDDEEYELGNSYYNYLTKGYGSNFNTSELPVKVGDTCTFYLDAFGKIAAHQIDVSSSDAIFGLLTKYAPGEGVYDDTMSLKVYADGGFTTYQAASKVRVDGTPYTGGVDIGAALDKVAADTTALYTDEKIIPILFETDENDNINVIDTPAMRKGESDYSLRSPKYYTETGFATLTYNKSSGMLSSKYRVDGNATILQLPTDVTDIDNDKKLSVLKGSGLADQKSYSIMLFNTDPDSSSATYGIIKDASASGTLGATDSEIHDKQMLVVSRVSVFLTEDGDKTIKIYGLQEGAEKEVVVDPEYYATDMLNDIWKNVGSAKKTIDGTADLANAQPSAARRSTIVLPGDAIRYRQDSSGNVSYALATFLIDVKVFTPDDRGNLEDTVRYRAFDIATIARKEGSMLYLKYLLPKTKAKSNATTSIELEFSDDGYILHDYNTSQGGADNKAVTQLYNEAEGTYVFPQGSSTWEIDAVQDASKFKIMVYDPTRAAGDRVRVGTVNDLYDTSAAPAEPASVVIMQFRSTNPRGMYVIKPDTNQ